MTMKRLITFWNSLLLCVVAANDLTAATLTLPLSAAGIRDFIASQNITTVSDFLTALPATHHEHFVLMHSSQSLHQATPLQPRQILFGADARFLLGISGVPDDPRYKLLEFAEYSPADGYYHFGTIDFGGPTPEVANDVAMCQNCHGQPARPIWGDYPHWPGAFGDQTGTIAAAERANFAAFVRAAPTSERYRHLRFDTDARSATFNLASRRYPYPNTNFNHELGNTIALGSLQRFKNSGNYPRGRWAALATSPALSCIDSEAWYTIVAQVNRIYADTVADRYPPTRRVDIKAVRLMGVDPVAEWSLEKIGNAVSSGLGGGWQTGAFKIEEAIAFQILVEALADTPDLQPWFTEQQSTIDYIRTKANLFGDERAAALRLSSAWYLFFDVFDPITERQSRLEQVCQFLAERI